MKAFCHHLPPLGVTKRYTELYLKVTHFGFQIRIILQLLKLVHIPLPLFKSILRRTVANQALRVTRVALMANGTFPEDRSCSLGQLNGHGHGGTAAHAQDETIGKTDESAAVVNLSRA